MTWRPAASVRSCSPTARAVWPPMPASTSSKTSVPRARLGRDAHEREHDAGELAARGGLAQRARGHARVRRDEELDLVAAARAVGLARRQPRLEARALHRQLGEHARPPRSASPAAAVSRAARSSAARASSSARTSASAARRVLERLLGARELVAPRAAGLRVREHRRDRAAVLALEPVERGQPLLDLVQPPRRGVHRLAVAAQLAGDVVGLDARARRRGRPARRARRRRRASPPAPPDAAASAAAAPPSPLSGASASIPPAAASRSPSRWRSRSRSATSDACSSSVGAERLDLADLPLEQVQLPVARAGALAQRLELGQQRPLARVAPPRTPRAAPPARPAEAVEDLELRRGRASACGARAARRTRAAPRRGRAGRRPSPSGRRRTRACGPRRSRAARARPPRRPRAAAPPSAARTSSGSSNVPST